MNALFLVSETLTDFGGVSKKIIAQVNALKNLGLHVALSYLEANVKDEFTGRFINEEKIDKYASFPVINQIQWRCQYRSLFNYINDKGIQVVFIRYIHFANPFFISFLKKLKRINVTILLEIPTYPYDQENKKKVFFHIAGDSDNTEPIRYKELVKKCDLSNYVIFYGRKTGKELDMIYNKADIAVGSLGCHRISIKNVKTLKNREYCARGLPFFYSETDVDFEDKDFIFKVPSNDSPIEIEEIINFVTNNKLDEVKIRKYACENLTWEKQFEKVLNEVFPNFKIPVTFQPE